MIRASKLSMVFDIIKQWYSEGTPMVIAEEILGVKPGRLITKFRENSMLDAFDRPGPNQTSQDFINVFLLWLALLPHRPTNK